MLDLSHSFVPDSDLWGSPGKVHWFLQALEQGETTLVLDYYRLSQGPGSATGSFLVHIVVH